ncbi:MAG: 16S rRNA (cytosine(967)-C(5))-methyltransferase RsmB [Akkermansiaceae bacterium]
MPQQSPNVRRAAVSALRAWAKGHTYMDSLIERHAARNGLARQDRALLQSIVYSVLRNRRVLDTWIGTLRKGKLDHETRDILRVGISQLLLLGIADHAAVNETVNCGKAPVRGLINAVLRQAITRRADLLSDREKFPPPVRYSHPDWLWNHWRQKWGNENTLALMEWNNRPAEVLGRINPLLPEASEAVLAHEQATPIEGLEGFVKIEGTPPGDWMKHGYVYIQDPATRHCVELLNPQPGETILDACAAPGGKTALMAAAMNNEGQILCTDSNEKRLPRLEHNLENLGIKIAKVEAHDWCTPAPENWHGKFDAILLDVPCSNTGVLRRRVDARWRLSPDSISELGSIQNAILENSLPCLAEGGRIIYSTCSIEPTENEELIQAFIDRHSDWKITETRQALPFQDKTDGAFAARIERA